MKLTLEGIKNSKAWEDANIVLPNYDVEKVSKKAQDAPKWVHFGVGNIFRIFIGGIADGLLEEGNLDRGITCLETFDYEVVDKIALVNIKSLDHWLKQLKHSLLTQKNGIV